MPNFQGAPDPEFSSRSDARMQFRYNSRLGGKLSLEDKNYENKECDRHAHCTWSMEAGTSDSVPNGNPHETRRRPLSEYKSLILLAH